MSTVLVVEDSLTQREMISALLETVGLNVLRAKDGVEALSLVHSHRPDLVVLDILLPRMNGYEVCRRLKGDKTLQPLSVVLYSSKNSAIDFYWGSKQGADAYLSKLCHPQELVDTVKQLLANNQAKFRTSVEPRGKSA